jgi:hypothetical protein
VIKKIHKAGTSADPLRGLFEAKIDGKPAVVEYEPDRDLRDTEQVPLLEEGGIEAFLRREVLPHAPDAWYVPESVKTGYEISFTRYFYKPQPLRTLEEIRADILARERTDAEGLEGLGEIEQAAIVRFLDHADRRIRRYVRAKQKLIKLLEEQKQAIIHQAVTRGLDPSVPTKDSALPWVPRVPAHWDLVPNRAHLKVRKVLVRARHGEFELLSLTKRGVIVRDISENKGKFSSDLGTSQEVRPGDLVFCLFDVPETPRTVGLSSHVGMITGAYTVFECVDPAVAR